MYLEHRLIINRGFPTQNHVEPSHQEASLSSELMSLRGWGEKPATMMFLLVMEPASGEHRKDTGSAQSSGHTTLHGKRRWG